MTVKEILITTSTMLGREDVTAYLNGDVDSAGENTLPTINVMVNLLNLVIGELAGTFIPMVKSEKISTNNGKVYYTDLTERALEIKNVFDFSGTRVSYRQTAEFIAVSCDNVIVEYEYAPPNYGLDDKIGFTEKDVALGTLAYGLAAEYSISLEDFDQAVMWHKRYVDSIAEHRKVHNATIKERSFV
ncbi:MAG: hypothetical protein IKB30_01205 [Clostridia bacterium]|nr:hypothetical protein [Clostridia bacterium]